MKPTRIDIDQATVLDRFVVRLRDQLNLTEQQCFETVDVRDPPRVPAGGEYLLLVAGGNSTFEEGEQSPQQCTENWTIEVGIVTRIALDPPGHYEKVLRDAGRGLLPVKRAVLRALVGHDLTTVVEVEETDSSSSGGFPIGGGNTFLRQLLWCRSCGRPESWESSEPGVGCCILPLEFGVSFDWDLTT